MKKKNRVGKLEANINKGYPKRLALTYACNQPGDVPPVPKEGSSSPYVRAVQFRYNESMEKLKAAVDSVNPFHKVGEAMKKAAPSKPQDIGQKAYDEAVKRGKR